MMLCPVHLPPCLMKTFLFLCLSLLLYSLPLSTMAQVQHPSLQEYSREQQKKRRPSAPEQPRFPYKQPNMLDPVLEGGDDNPFIIPENPDPVPIGAPMAGLMLAGLGYGAWRLRKSNTDKNAVLQAAGPDLTRQIPPWSVT